MSDFSILSLIAGIPGLIIAMVVHEYAHARMAVTLGDFTPRLMGRLTLDPRAHIDPIGLLMLFLVRFGWAKPVTINPNNFKQPRRDDILVSVAGPAANLIIAFVTLFLLVLFTKYAGRPSSGAIYVLRLIIIYNINFAIFNMIPIPPLDGSHILRELLPRDLAYQFDRLERYSFLILIVFLMTPILDWVFVPMQKMIWQLFTMLLGIFF
ncbi:site-2 protease family protein [Selenomonas sp.]|uniref:site-2 protease family protein n=1 Tax=Selenomonas sp. TaxID=2053611 RepID=UPI002A753576|nr:site-2 protease family protein [Selenomonas sp.]MDY3297301.1 site-2 protease family protein [Selenomonas sp.]